jgi:hypothetical protein
MMMEGERTSKVRTLQQLLDVAMEIKIVESIADINSQVS